MKKLGITALLLTILVVLLSVIGCSDNDNKSTEIKPPADVGKTTSYLFVQNATSGAFVANGDGTYTFTMNGVSPQTIYFSDRPERDAGQVAMQTFLDSMCFNSNNPPNAAIDVLGAGKENDVAIVELTNPVYDSSAATLQYTARILEDANHSVASFNERNDRSIPQSFDAVALFIDDCSDIDVECGNSSGHSAGGVTCCICWSWERDCDFQSDCCSFSRCQNSCKDKYGDSNKYIKDGNGAWVDNADDWYNNESRD